MDMIAVRDAFAAAKTGGGDVEFEALIKGYEEIARLYDSMGTLFHFASNDMRSRVKVLRTLSKENAAIYSAVISALDHEKAQGIKKKTKSGVTSASKVLLAMHWDISFLILVMQRLGEGQDDTKMSPLVRKAYDEAVAAHEPLPIRTAARLAIKTLPVRKDFIRKYIKQESAEALALVTPTVVALKLIHAIMEGAFIKHDLMKEAHAEAEKNRAEDAAQPPVQ